MSIERKSHWAFAAYQIDRAYGGPEEGGWWYDCGELVRVVAMRFCTEGEAYRLARHANDWLYRLQKDKREVSSIIYDGQRFAVYPYPAGQVEAYYPATRPHYE